MFISGSLFVVCMHFTFWNEEKSQINNHVWPTGTVHGLINLSLRSKDERKGFLIVRRVGIEAGVLESITIWPKREAKRGETFRSEVILRIFFQFLSFFSNLNSSCFPGKCFNKTIVYNWRTMTFINYRHVDQKKNLQKILGSLSVEKKNQILIIAQCNETSNH